MDSSLLFECFHRVEFEWTKRKTLWAKKRKYPVAYPAREFVFNISFSCILRKGWLFVFLARLAASTDSVLDSTPTHCSVDVAMVDIFQRRATRTRGNKLLFRTNPSKQPVSPMLVVGRSRLRFFLRWIYRRYKRKL